MVLALLFSMPISALAFTGQSGNVVVLEKGQTKDSNYYAAGNTVEIYGTVNGDVFVAGDTVTINSDNINGDVFVAASNIDIKGNINGSLRLVGEKINISAEVTGNIMAAGQNLTLDADTKLAGHLTFWGQMASISGQVDGRLEGAMETLRISGQLSKDVDVYLSSGQEAGINIADSARIGGTLYYQSLKELPINQNAQIGGVSFNQIIKKEKSNFNTGKVLALSMNFFGMLVIAMLAMYLWPRFFSSAYHVAYKKPWQTLLKGFLLLVATPIACLLIAISVIGLPLAIVTIVLWAVLLYLMTIMTAWLIGKFVKERFFVKRAWPKLAILALGIFLFIVLKNIPFIGGLVVAIVYMMAWGTLVLLFKKESN